jgi:hypothetical protein
LSRLKNPGAGSLGADVREIIGEVVLADTERAAAEGDETPGTGQQIALHQDVIGDRQHVELAGAAVEVDDLGHRQGAVAPAGVDVEVAEEKRLVPWHGHELRTSTWVVSFGR